MNITDHSARGASVKRSGDGGIDVPSQQAATFLKLRFSSYGWLGVTMPETPSMSATM